MQEPTAERVVADFVAGLDPGDVPEGAVRTAERAFVDTVGVTLAGAAADAGERAGRFAALYGAGDGATLLGREGRAALPAAALANGTAGHALDYDDLCWAMDGHPSVPLVPAVLAVGEHVGASGRDAVAAYAAGFEAMSSLAGPVSPRHYELGWHPTATFGTFGATAAAAHLLDADAGTVRQALSVAASMPAGLKRNFGSMTKPLHAGLAARSGVTAALLADDGFTADEAPVSGEDGFWDLYADGAGGELPRPGDPWALVETGINVKPYPCCYFTHTTIAATASLVAESEAAPADIERIEVRASAGAGDALAHADPATGLEAKFSMEHCAAAGAACDRVGLEEFTDAAARDPTLAALRERVEFEVDPELPYDAHAATVAVVTDQGRFEEHRADPPGTHDDPLSEAELRRKFTECATAVLSEERAAAAHGRLNSLAERESLAGALSGL